MRLHAVLIAAALFVPGLAQAAGCSFVAPSPLLRAHTYPEQSFTAKPDNAAVETATLDGGVALQITLSQCVDAVEHDFVLTAPPDPKHPRDFAAWVDFAAATLGGLKVRDANTTAQLLAFLKKARVTAPKVDMVSLCRNGKALPVCDWDSGGEFRIEVQPMDKGTRLTIIESISG